ncbi:MAG: helix-turn-helix transcriptional regulator, partial [Deltaproteobacteria bacterium]
AVAVYAMKGFSNGEIAELRKTSIPTVKSQMKAIFRKAGLDNRQQLIAFLVEELLSGVALKNPEDVKDDPTDDPA